MWGKKTHTSGVRSILVSTESRVVSGAEKQEEETFLSLSLKT